MLNTNNAHSFGTLSLNPLAMSIISKEGVTGFAVERNWTRCSAPRAGQGGVLEVRC